MRKSKVGKALKRKKLMKVRNNKGTKEKQTALGLVQPCGLLHPAGGDSGTHQQLCRCLLLPDLQRAGI